MQHKKQLKQKQTHLNKENDEKRKGTLEAHKGKRVSRDNEEC